MAVQQGDSEGKPYLSALSEFGLTKREYFAGLAMQGILSNAYTFGRITRAGETIIEAHEPGAAARESAKYADALLAELSRETPPDATGA